MTAMNTKQVIVVRSDLNMPKGKAGAQIAHASMAFLTRRLDPTCCYHPSASTVMLSEVEQHWLDNSFVKVVVKVSSEAELIDIANQATKANIECHAVTDDGRTMFDNVPTLTCIALGPDIAERIDPITGHLRLL